MTLETLVWLILAAGMGAVWIASYRACRQHPHRTRRGYDGLLM